MVGTLRPVSLGSDLFAAFSRSKPADEAVAVLGRYGKFAAFANQATTDAATNVALQMYLPDGSTSVTPGTETSNIQLADSAEQTVTFKVDYIATGKATSGNVNAVTNFHINYY